MRASPSPRDMPGSFGAVPTRLLVILDWIVPPRGRPAAIWRRRMLGLLLAGFALLAAIPYALGMVVAVRVGAHSVMVVDTAIYLLLLGVLFARRAPFAWRAGFVVSLPLLLGSFLLSRFGATTSGFVWLMVAPLMASVLFSVRISLALLALQAAILTGIGSMLVANTAWWPIRQPGDVSAWVTTSSSYVAVTMLLSYAIAILFQGLAKEAEARQTAEREADRQQQMAALGTIATAMAHDVNNLLQPLLSDIELLRQDTLGHGERTALLDRMVTSIDQARGLMRRARRFARPAVEARVPIDLAHVVPEAVRTIRAMVPKSVHLVVAPMPSTYVLADAAEIQRMLVLLIANATDALPPGGSVRVTVTGCDHASLAVAPPPGAHRVAFAGQDMTAGVSDRLVMIQVHDNGSGMTPDAMATLHAAVTTAADNGTDSLGLGTVQETLQSLGGMLRLCSRVGDGACAEIILPQHDGPLTPAQTGEWRNPNFVTALPSATVTTGENQTVTEASALPLESMFSDSALSNTILVVDDESAVLQATSRLLERMGFRAICTSDPLAVEGLIPAITPPVTMVLTDVHMPGLDGWQLAQRLRSAYPELPVVMMSGHVDSLHAHGSDHPGVVALVAKPFTSKELGRAIERAIG